MENHGKIFRQLVCRCQLAHYQQHTQTTTVTLSTGQKTQLLGRAQTKYAREFKEAWHSTDDDTIDRHIDIPTAYLQLKTERKNSVNNDTKITNINIVNLPITLQSTSRTYHSYNFNNTLIPNNNMQSSMTTHPSTTNDNTSTCIEPIRRYIYVNYLYSEEDSKYRVERLL